MLSAHCGTDSKSAAQGRRPRAPTIHFKDLRLLGRLHSFGEPWLEHDERYRRSEEFIQILKGFWTQDRFTFKGDFYRINEGWLKPRPVSAPEVFQGGNSKAARRMAAKYSDWYFINGNSIEGSKSRSMKCARSPRPRGELSSSG
jgi:FMNH2-dependent dimethyl sulfone monooxygenase